MNSNTRRFGVYGLSILVGSMIVVGFIKLALFSKNHNPCFDDIEGTELTDPKILYEIGDYFRAKNSSGSLGVASEINGYLKARPDNTMEIRLVGWPKVKSLDETVVIESFNAESGVKISTVDALLQKKSDDADCNPYVKDGCEGNWKISLGKADVKLITGGSRAFYLKVTTRSGTSTPFIFGLSYEKIATEDVWLMVPDYTWAAYNSFGGGSFYKTNIIEGGSLKSVQRKSRLYSLNLDRPFDSSFNSHNQDRQKLPIRVLSDCLKLEKYGRDSCVRKFRAHPESILAFGRVLDSKGVRFSYVPMSYLDDSFNREMPKLLIFGSHNEYWTSKSVKFLKEHLARGAKVLNLSGNIAWWQVNKVGTVIHLDQLGQHRSTECKKVRADTFDGTGNYGTGILPNMVNILGVGYKYGGYGIQNINWDASTKQEYLHRGDSKSRLRSTASRFSKYFDHEYHYKGDSIIIDDEIDGVPLTYKGNVNADELGSEYGRAELFGFANVVAVNRVSLRNGSEYFGDLDSGVFLNYCPVGGGRVLNLASIGFSYALLVDDSVTRAMFGDLLKSISDDSDVCQ